MGIAFYNDLAYITHRCSASGAQEQIMIRHLAWVFAFGMALQVGAAFPAVAAAPEPEDAWPALADDIFKGVRLPTAPAWSGSRCRRAPKTPRSCR